jgi:opacity protein-like surface antigen
MRSLACATAAATLWLAVAVPALAQEARPGPYGGLIYSSITYDQSGATSASLANFAGLIGQVINPHWAVEGRLGFTLYDDPIMVGSTPVDVGLNYASGLLKGILPLAPRFGLYGVAGISIGHFRASSPALYVHKWETDFSYGAGVEIGFLPTKSLTVEWQRLFEGSGYKVDATSVALNFRF